MNPFAQENSIWFKERAELNRVFDLFKENMPKEVISRIYTSYNNPKITLKDGSIIRFLIYSESCRGYRHSASFIAESFNCEEINEIYCKTILGEQGLYIIDTKDWDSIDNSIRFRKTYQIYKI